MSLKRLVKRVAKTLTPKPLRRIVDKSLESFLDPKAGLKDAKRVGKSIVRAPGKWVKPKMPEQTKATVFQQEDEERTKQRVRSRTAARRGARSSSMLSDDLGG